VNVEIILPSICTIRHIDQSVDQLQQAIILFYYYNCPVKNTRSPWIPPWWNKKLSGIRAKTRKLFNIAKRTGPWDTYKVALTCYNKQIRKANDPHGVGTARRSVMYQAVPDS
jgi:hypothetical protein